MHLRSTNAHQQKQKEATQLHNSTFQSKRERKSKRETDNGHMNTGLSLYKCGWIPYWANNKREREVGVHGLGWMNIHFVLNVDYLSLAVAFVSTIEKVVRSDIKKAIPLSGRVNDWKQRGECVMVWVSIFRYLSVFTLFTALIRVIWKYEHLGQASRSDRLCARLVL